MGTIWFWIAVSLIIVGTLYAKGRREYVESPENFKEKGRLCRYPWRTMSDYEISREIESMFNIGGGRYSFDKSATIYSMSCGFHHIYVSDELTPYKDGYPCNIFSSYIRRCGNSESEWVLICDHALYDACTEVERTIFYRWEICCNCCTDSFLATASFRVASWIRNYLERAGFSDRRSEEYERAYHLLKGTVILANILSGDLYKDSAETVKNLDYLRNKFLDWRSAYGTPVERDREIWNKILPFIKEHFHVDEKPEIVDRVAQATIVDYEEVPANS